MSIADRNGLVALVLLPALVFAVRRRRYALAIILGFGVLDFGVDALTRWFAPDLHDAISAWFDKYSGP